MKIQAPDGTNYPIIIADKPLGTVNRGVIRGRKALIEGILSERAGSEPNLFYHSPRLGSSSIVPSVVEHAHANAPSGWRFNLELPLESWSFADLASVTFYGIIEGSSYALAVDKAGYHLSSGVVNRHNVYPLISHPATRISDRETLIAYATDALHRSSDDPTTAAACLCTIGYRELEDNRTSDGCLTLKFGPDLPQLLSKLSERNVYRWFVSVNLMLSYFHVIRNEYELAAEVLSRILNAEGNLSHTPQMLTNTLKACLLAGFIARKCAKQGEAMWHAAMPCYKLASGVWEFENHYSYSELRLSIGLLQQCFAAAHLEAISLGKQESSLFLAPKDLKVDFSMLGFPAGRYKFGQLFGTPQIPIVG